MFYLVHMNKVLVNGKLLSADKASVPVDNHSYRYGDGLFETMKVVQGRLLLSAYHADRLWSSMKLLQYRVPAHFTPVKLEEEILNLCEVNACSQLARVRLSVTRGSGGLYDGDDKLQYLAECWPLSETIQELHTNGLVAGVYRDMQKPCDQFANCKSSSFLPYVMGAVYAKQQKWNEALVLNTHQRIADATTANVFIIKDKTIFTPPLSEGCIDGVMRRHLLTALPGEGFAVEERPLTVEEVETADEVFLSNAIHGLRWVGRFNETTYVPALVPAVYRALVRTIF